MSGLIKKSVIHLSDNAIKRIGHLIRLNKDNDIIGVKFSLKNRGCNGKSYNLSYLKKDDINKYDENIFIDNIHISIDSKAIIHILGTRVDYVDTPIASEFVFNNPNSKGTCGCGESFNV